MGSFWMAAVLLAAGQTFDHTHALWTTTLKEYVTIQGAIGEVAYGRLQKDTGKLDRYLDEIQKMSLDDFRSFSRDEQLAFLINAYNAFTVKLILNHYPVKSIKDTGGFFSSPWKKRFFTLFGEKRHLDEIEHGMIRRDEKMFDGLEAPLRETLKKFDDPRIHFALNCASKGCPALQAEAFVPSKLDAQIEEATRLFLQDRTRNIFDREKMELRLSSIFKWYGEDFVNKSGSVQEFVAPKMGKTPEEVETIRTVKKVKYLDYDWTLNGG